jgi:uncharacterized protein YecE (DUF72 family)
MARGWESKSIELQQSDAPERETKVRIWQTPEQIGKAREREGLLLSRTRILQQLQVAQNPRHQQMLRDAMSELDARLTKLDN